MKKLTMMVAVLMIATAPAFATPLQEQAHSIADQAREMRLPESNPIIMETSRIWWEEAVNQNRIAEERTEWKAAHSKVIYIKPLRVYVEFYGDEIEIGRAE